MPSPARFLALPSSVLLLLLATSIPRVAPDPQWPYNLPVGAKYWPEEETVVKRSFEVQERLNSGQPVGVRKMSGDEGEKFFLEYWQFDEEAQSWEGEEDGYAAQFAGDTPRIRRRAVGEEGDGAYANSSMQTALLPPFLLHDETVMRDSKLEWLFPRALLQTRSFQCPTGTNNCSSIQRPNSCCATDETCVIVDDSDLGDVGCCPSGGNCGGTVSDCDTSQGYTSCPGSDNGGCCIPNFTCEGIGCKSISASTATTTLPTVTVTGSQSANGTTAAAPPPTSSTCSSGFRSCPSSVGGGCCATDRECGSHTCPPSSSSSPVDTPTVTTTTTEGTPLPPNRPTTVASSSARLTTFTTTQSGGGGSVCPTGFYQCSAYYGGGCCRVGRDCQSTSCPTPATQTVVVSNGVTIVAGSGFTPSLSSAGPSGTRTITSTGTVSAAAAALTGTCAQGWSTCSQSVGGGCCPTGFECGASCTATSSGVQGTQAKMTPSGAGRVEGVEWSLGVLMVGAGIVSLVGMVLL
ncbi:hypothetical protein NA57DRAFT_54381 [Rhizodiscina lignyota]|uniref:GPI anchored protein n=1 Tax=Rhizodiscina lignyota TaxID=1504668 RepID=A0A9P4IJA7_9PEZI|nr:hypothetical protein NA57DRAFT_54381 [Rhizodiscina lignyota]